MCLPLRSQKGEWGIKLNVRCMEQFQDFLQVYALDEMC